MLARGLEDRVTVTVVLEGPGCRDSGSAREGSATAMPDESSSTTSSGSGATARPLYDSVLLTTEKVRLLRDAAPAAKKRR